MTKLNEAIKQNLKKVYNDHKGSFKKLSFSTEHNRSCVESDAIAICGDSLKNNCCKDYKNVKSVDAISFNKNRFIFIEFKIKSIENLKNVPKELLNELRAKFSGSWECFQHNIDKKHLYQKQEQQKLFVYKVHNDFKNSRLCINPLTESLGKINIEIMRSESFKKHINDYEYKLN